MSHPNLPPEILARYISRRIDDIRVLQDSVESGNFDIPERIGHQLKGNGESFGFPDFAIIGKEIETSAREKNSARLQTLVEDFEKLVHATQMAFRSKLEPKRSCQSPVAGESGAD